MSLKKFKNIYPLSEDLRPSTFYNFRDLLYGAPGFIEPPEVPDHLPDVSLVSGRMRGGTGRVEGEGGELVVVNDRTIGLLHSGGGGEFLANR